MRERRRLRTRPALERNGRSHRLEVQEVTRIRLPLKELSESGLHIRSSRCISGRDCADPQMQREFADTSVGTHRGKRAAQRPALKKKPAKTSGG
jgi:hypothetical protein